MIAASDDRSRGVLALGIDVGTSQARACVIDSDRHVVSFGRADIAEPLREGGRIEQDPALWWDAVCAAVRTAVADVEPIRIGAIAIDGTSGSVLMVDAAGRPLAPALMYNDQSARAQADRIAAAAPPDSPARGAGSTLARVLSLLDRGVHGRILHQADWIAGRFRNVYGESDETNALKLGYDPFQRCWPDFISTLGVPAQILPEVRPVGTALGPIAPSTARLFGLRDDVQVVAGTTDSVAATIATGAREIGDAVTSLGSTLVLKVLADRPVASAANGICTHRVGDLFLAGGASNTGGAVLRALFTMRELEDLSATIDPHGEHDLDFYPLLAPGERFPVNDPALAPRLEPRPRDRAAFLGAMLHAIARIERDGYRLLQSLGAPYPKRVVTAGGGARNLTWTAMREGLLGVPVIAAPVTEAAYGAALLALAGIEDVRS